MMTRILAVDDEEDILEVLRFNLAREGFAVDCAVSGEEALKKAAEDPPGLILLDLMLPGRDGISVCRELRTREATSRVPIVMLTAKGEESDVVAGLEAGADDYVTKPFSPRVLVARVRAALRRRSRTEAEPGKTISRHGVTINIERHEVTAGEEKASLTATEFALLEFLARRPGWVFTRAQIIDAVKGEGYAVTDRAVDVQVLGLRRKLGQAGKVIETVRGVGYRFKE